MGIDERQLDSTIIKSTRFYPLNCCWCFISSVKITETSGTQIVDLTILRHPVAMKQIYDTMVR